MNRTLYVIIVAAIVYLKFDIVFFSDLDAAGKPPSGIMRGNLYWGVNVEQCRAISNSHMCGTRFTLAIPSMQLVCSSVSLSLRDVKGK